MFPSEHYVIKQSLVNIQSLQIKFAVDQENTKTLQCPTLYILVEDISFIKVQALGTHSHMDASEYLDSTNNGSINKLNRGNKHKS